jgi:ATP-dependent DNA helicase RecG
MTATPIPRTLVLTYFGDMDVSILDEKPAAASRSTPGLMPISSGWRGGRTASAAHRRRRAGLLGLPAGRENPKARSRRRRGALRRDLPGSSATARRPRARPDEGRGQGRGDGRFASAARLKILVATTVIEVGVDVPEASIMVIEHAERFGLAQLHQLRGRVGRGAQASTCLLLYKGRSARRRRRGSKIMRETEDGFRIAEEDLRCAAKAICSARANPACPAASRFCGLSPVRRLPALSPSSSAGCRRVRIPTRSRSTPSPFRFSSRRF